MPLDRIMESLPWEAAGFETVSAVPTLCKT